MINSNNCSSRIVHHEGERLRHPRRWRSLQQVEKDTEFVDAMLDYGLVQIDVLRSRLADTQLEPARSAKASAWLKAREPRT